MASNSQDAANQISLNSLSLDDLMRLKTQFESELHKLTSTVQLTNDSLRKADQSKSDLLAFSKSQSGSEMLVPITESMYVTGKVGDTKRPIIELGTGYYAETSVENATAYIDRRIKRLSAQQEALRQTFKDKQQKYQMIGIVANQKLQQQQKRQQ